MLNYKRHNMDIQLNINGLYVEGVEPSAVKLTINNSDPLKFTDRTVTYSASITVPRTEINDRIFKEMRTPWLYVKKTMYVAMLTFGGLPAPINGGRFKAKVAAKKDSYTIELIELFSKFSSIHSEFSGAIPSAVPVTGVSWTILYNQILRDAYANIVIPEQTLNGNPIQMGLWADTKEATAGEFVGLPVTLWFRNSSNGDYQSVYPENYMVMDNSDAALALRRFSGATFTLQFTPEQYVIMPAGTSGAIRFRIFSPTTTTYVPLNPVSTNADGTVKYALSGAAQSFTYVTTYNIRPRAELVNAAGTRVFPARNVPVEDALTITLEIKSVMNPDTTIDKLVTSAGFNSGYDLLMAYCKTFAWTYQYIESTNTVILKPFIDPTVKQTTSPKRVNWSGRIDVDTIEVSEIEGIARSMVYTVGERSFRFGAYQGALDSLADGAQSPFAVKTSRLLPITEMFRTLGTGYAYVSYFGRPDGYRKDVGGYYSYFRKGYQVRCTAYLSYFDIEAFKNDGCYRFEELNEYFYVRNISNWDASTGKCTLNLISLDLT